MSAPVVGRESVLGKLEFGAVTAAGSIQQPPEVLVLEFGEIGHSGLRAGHRPGLIGADIGCYGLVDAISAFHGFPRRGPRFGIWNDTHGS